MIELDPDAMEMARQTRRLRESWGHLASAFEWHHVGTFTTRYRASIDLIFRLLAQWAASIREVHRRVIEWLAFPESTEEGGYHLHALVHGTRGLSDVALRRPWQRVHGHYVKIEPYLPDRGFEYYMAKEVSLNYSEGRFSPDFIGTRKAGRWTNGVLIERRPQ